MGKGIFRTWATACVCGREGVRSKEVRAAGGGGGVRARGGAAIDLVLWEQGGFLLPVRGAKAPREFRARGLMTGPLRAVDHQRPMAARPRAVMPMMPASGMARTAGL